MSSNRDAWYDNRSHLLEVGQYLVDVEQHDAQRLLAFFEKPWNYEEEFKACQKAALAAQASEVQNRIERNLSDEAT